MLTWPHGGSDWTDSLDAVYQAFAAIGATVSADQTVLSVCEAETHRDAVRQRLLAAGADPTRLRFVTAPSDDAWARDHGPITTLSARGAVVNDFDFNGWGGKFSADLDNAITGHLHTQGVFGHAELNSPGLVLEGGAIETDGRGTLLATRSATIGPTRNPGLGVSALERRLGDHLGLHRFLWLDHGGLTGDDTDGHIDTLARFADPGTILYTTAPPGHPDHPELSAMAGDLARFRTASGAPYRLIALPSPGEHRDEDGALLPATYANFLITNRHVLLPVYGVASDRQAADRLAEAFPGRRIVPIDCRAIIRQHGSLHCVTMQFPAALELEDPRGQIEP
jgi:agmatine/peptidylarginine deiminase